jgi:hypothetical protein
LNPQAVDRQVFQRQPLLRTVSDHLQEVSSELAEVQKEKKKKRKKENDSRDVLKYSSHFALLNAIDSAERALKFLVGWLRGVVRSVT